MATKTPAKKSASAAKAPAQKAPAEKTQKEPSSLTTTAPLKYFGLEDHISQENSQAVIIPCPYEATVRYGKGTMNGPRAILEASQQVERFDEELWAEPYKIGIHTMNEIKMPPMSSEVERPFAELQDVVKPLVEFSKFPIIIGGERSITLGGVRACVERYADLSVLQIGAHSDCRKSSEGNMYSHMSIGYQLYKRTLKQPLITQVGVRNISAEEVTWMERDKPNINIFWARHQDKWNFQEIVSTLSDNVYLSVDVDGLDGSIMPSTGTPEPGGMTWYQLLGLIKVLFIKKNVVGADIVELAPIEGMHAPDFLCAKLLYKMIGYRFALELGVTKKYL